LRHRRRTGQGQYIDMAQTEPTIALLGPQVMDYTVNGINAGPRGNASSDDAAPYGAYPCAGEDRWIALGVHDDGQWARLVEALGRPDWATQAAFSSAEGRRAHRADLDALLAKQTAGFDTSALAQTLQAAGIPAARVSTAADVIEDPQLAHRGHWLTLDHPEMGPSLYNAQPFRMKHAPPGGRRPAPLLGQHTHEVCRDLLGLSPDDIDALAADGALT
jgi:benzylsuccinate CoA-transferase BbsF subunit